MGHLILVANDCKVQSVDQQKLKGYIMKWRDRKCLLDVYSFTMY